MSNLLKNLAFTTAYILDSNNQVTLFFAVQTGASDSPLRPWGRFAVGGGLEAGPNDGANHHTSKFARKLFELC